jgi:hypothetical protein
VFVIKASGIYVWADDAFLVVKSGGKYVYHSVPKRYFAMFRPEGRSLVN